MTAGLDHTRGSLTHAVDLLRDSATAFSEDRARRLSAGLAYYAIFALVPALMTSVFIAAIFVGKEAAGGTLSDGIQGVLGRDFAVQLEDAIASAWDSTNTSGFAVLSLLVVAYTASVLFVAWRDTLEVIWDVPYTFGVRTTIMKRVHGMLIPVLVGIVLAAIIVVQTVVALLSELSRFGLIDATLRVAGTALPAVVAVITLACLYRYSTRAAKPPWSHVLRGAAVAWVGLAVLSWGFGIYLRVIGTTSFAGAASSIVVGLVLLYYGAQILVFGAEVVRCSADDDPALAWRGGERRDGER
ncbi:MAG: YihY/virulence factor BrkB family protein [Acidimicrobiia bacterium]|nr:YihY/virulence factor BrkB family protein [Acidimicrobiia bacterium]